MLSAVAGLFECAEGLIRPQRNETQDVPCGETCCSARPLWFTAWTASAYVLCGHFVWCWRNTEVKTSELSLVVQQFPNLVSDFSASMWLWDGSAPSDTDIKLKSLTCFPGQRNISDLLMLHFFFELCHTDAHFYPWELFFLGVRWLSAD